MGHTVNQNELDWHVVIYATSALTVVGGLIADLFPLVLRLGSPSRRFHQQYSP
jgi:hypothetical protein